eukprot:SAG31_NODE_2589_length_5427_cov_3.886449_3_plen_243_part_00
MLRTLCLLVSAAGVAGSATLLPGQKLAPGEFLTDGNGYLLMQTDGDLTVCTALSSDGTTCGGDGAVFSAGCAGNPGAYAEMQEFGVLSVFPKRPCEGPTDCRLWQSHTMAAAGCTTKDVNCSYVAIQKDGNVVMHTGASPATPGPVIWTTGTRIMPKNTKNVLWMIADDMRPDMKAAYGQAHMITPAFDRLAKEGSVFTRAYCQIAVCAPSRNSFMSKWLAFVSLLAVADSVGSSAPRLYSR